MVNGRIGIRVNFSPFPNLWFIIRIADLDIFVELEYLFGSTDLLEVTDLLFQSSVLYSKLQDTSSPSRLHLPDESHDFFYIKLSYSRVSDPDPDIFGRIRFMRKS